MVNDTGKANHGPAGVSGASEKERGNVKSQSNLKQDSFFAPNRVKTRISTLSHRMKSPPGGYDATPVPEAPAGLTVRITFHRASNLPTADLNSLSSDPFVVAHLIAPVVTRHKEDPPLTFRTPTVHRSRDPEWDAQWIVANVPAAGFRLKMRIFDEDQADRDDRLGNAHLVIPGLSESWPGVHEQGLKIKKRMGSKRAWIVTGCTMILSSRRYVQRRLFVSVEVLGPTQGRGGKIYTVGPQYWITHYSPMIGRIVGTKVPGEKGKAHRHNFQANEVRLHGPVPDQLYHRYVEFKPFVKGMFTRAGLRGRIFNHALHHQHSRVYNYDRSTDYSTFEGPCIEMTKHFLHMVHYDQGSRMFTYVLTLDGLFRFTETGKEFGIDMLSKHSMHSDVSVYVAYSGEFHVRRMRRRQRHPPRSHSYNRSNTDLAEKDDDVLSPTTEEPYDHDEEDPPRDPACYELIIDNDSGTYRPTPQHLPLLQEFLASNFPGLKVRTMACNDENLIRMKKDQRERKKTTGDVYAYLQYSGSESSSISSSDVESLDERVRRAEEGDYADPDHLRRYPSSGPIETGMRIVSDPKEFVKDWVARERKERQEKGKEKDKHTAAPSGAPPGGSGNATEGSTQKQDEVAGPTSSSSTSAKRETTPATLANNPTADFARTK